MTAAFVRGMGVAAALELVRRPGGVTAAELRDVVNCHAAYSHQVLSLLLSRHACVRGRGNAKPWRYFSSQECLLEWQKQQRNIAAAHVVIGRRPKTIKRASSRPAQPAPPAVQPAQEPVITSATVYTRYTTPDMLSRAPGVPGWGSGPVIREGAMDFKRHQHPASCVFTGGAS